MAQDTYPTELNVTDLMTAPDGLVRAGDEFHDPEREFHECEACGNLYPADSWHCCAENAVGDVPADVLASWGHE